MFDKKKMIESLLKPLVESAKIHHEELKMWEELLKTSPIENFTFTSNPIVYFKEYLRSPISFSWLKNKKKWMNKRRLHKKFNKHASQRYGVPLMVMSVDKAAKQIEKDVDSDIINSMKEDTK